MKMKNGTEKHIETVNYLAKLYDYCNEKLFGDELTRPVITVQRDERNKTNGWWSVKKVWKENDKDEGEHELNMTAQQLNHPRRYFLRRNNQAGQSPPRYTREYG